MRDGDSLHRNSVQRFFFVHLQVNVIYAIAEYHCYVRMGIVHIVLDKGQHVSLFKDIFQTS